MPKSVKQRSQGKKQKEWAELLGDPAITTSIVDRVLQKIVIIQLQSQMAIIIFSVDRFE